MVKFSILLKRLPSISHEEFIAYHRDKHAPLFSSLPEVKKTVRRYVQQHGVEATLPGLPSPKFDGITELWFDDVAALEALFTSEEYMRVVRPDEAKFLDLPGCEFVLSHEFPVIG